MEDYVGLKQAALFLDVCTRTVKVRISDTKQGRDTFPFYQDSQGNGTGRGGKYYFLKSELKAWRANKRFANKDLLQTF